MKRKYIKERIMRHEILRMLENNSRIDLHDLAIMLGTDESVVLEEIEKMENEGIICGYPTLINWDKTDTEKVTAFIEVRVTPQRGQGFEKLAERITNYPEVKSIYLMSGAFDFAIFLEGKTLKEVSMFVSTKLSTLEAVAGTATHFVLKKYKDHGMILIDKESANRMKVTP
jgi:DNA-binding Lrp family transcriptional regulator